MMREVEEEEYEQRLKKTKLMSLEMRRLRSDLIEVYKIMHNLEGLEREDFFPLRSAGRKGLINIPSPSSIVASTAENTYSHKGWSTSGTGYQLQPFVQRQLTGSKTRLTQCYGNTGGSFISQRRLPAPVLQTRRSAQV